MNDQGQAQTIHELEQVIANCSECGGLGLTKPDVRDPADPRFGKFVPCPACGPAVRELHEMRLMELLREPISRYTALVGDLLACTFGNFDTQQDGRLVNVRNAVIRFLQGEVPWVYVYGPPGNGKTHLPQRPPTPWSPAAERCSSPPPRSSWR